MVSSSLAACALVDRDPFLPAFEAQTVPMAHTWDSKMDWNKRLWKAGLEGSAFQPRSGLQSKAGRYEAGTCKHQKALHVRVSAGTRSPQPKRSQTQSPLHPKPRALVASELGIHHPLRCVLQEPCWKQLCSRRQQAARRSRKSNKIKNLFYSGPCLFGVHVCIQHMHVLCKHILNNVCLHAGTSTASVEICRHLCNREHDDRPTDSSRNYTIPLACVCVQPGLYVCRSCCLPVPLILE